MNNKYGKLKNDELKYAPSTLIGKNFIIASPTEQDYFDFGYKRVIDEPAPPSGKIAYVIGYTEKETTITVDYDYKDAPRVYRKFSKYKLLKNIMILGESTDSTDDNPIMLWTAIKKFLQEEQPALFDLFNAALIFDEADPYFETGKGIVMQKFPQLSEELVEYVLSNSIAD